MFYELRNHGQGAFEKLSNNFRRAIRDAQPNYLGRIAINNASILKVGVSRNDREAIGFRVFPDRAVICICPARNRGRAMIQGRQLRRIPPIEARGSRQTTASRGEKFHLAFTISCKCKASENVGFVQVGKVFQDLFVGHPGSEVFQHVVHSDTQASNTGLTPTFPGSIVMIPGTASLYLT